jgi:branched-chain amino acid transport system permease protein
VALAPLVVSGYELELATKILIFCLLAISLDFAWGYAGVFDLGRGVLFGWAAYAAGLLATRSGLTAAAVVLPITFLVGGGIALLAGLFLFLGQRRFNIIFVAMATLVFSYISERTANAWPTVGSANGIPNIPLMSILPGNPTSVHLGVPFYYLVTVLLAATYLGLRALVRSQFGLILAAARTEESDRRAGFFGYKMFWFRLFVYTLSGAIAGLAGGLYAFHEGYVSPNLLGVFFSTQIILWVLIGGRGTLIGSVVGTLLMNYVSLSLSGTFLTIWQIILGIILVVVITLVPGGVTGWLLKSDGSNFGGRLSLNRAASA